MNRAPSMYHLARALPEDERRELYKRITQSLNLSSQSEQRIYPAEMDQEHRKNLIKKDIEQLSLFTRIRLWFRRIFTGRALDEAFVEMRLADIRHELKHSSFRISDPDAARVDARVAYWLYALHQQIADAAGYVREMWSAEERIREMVSQLLAESVPSSKASLEEFISRQELADIFQNSESKEELRKAALRRLDSYIRDVHDDVFDHTKAKVLPVYYLRDLAFFRFSAFFAAFTPKGVAEKNVDEDESELEQFRDAELHEVIDLLESLYCALHLAAQSAPIDGEVARAHMRVVSPDDWKEEDVKKRVELIRVMQEHVRSFLDSAPLVDLVKFHRGDPYHRLLLYTPKLRLRQFYHSSMKIKILSELDEIYPELRLKVIGEIVHTIFGPEPGELYHYRGVAGGNIKKYGLPTFRYVRSLNIAHQMVRRVYAARYQHLIRLLLRIMPPGKREISESLHTNGVAVEELADRIRDFDAALAPEEEEGKLFHNVRQSSDIELAQQRAYGVLVSQKDREAREIVTETRDHFQELGEAFENLVSSVSDQLRERYRAFDPESAGKASLDAILTDRSVELRNFTTLMNQIVAVEESE